MSKATCCFLGGKADCRRVGPQPCAQIPSTSQDLGWGSYSCTFGCTNFCSSTTRRNLHVTDPLAAVFSLLPLGFNHQEEMVTPVQSWTVWGVQCKEGLCNGGAQALLSPPQPSLHFWLVAAQPQTSAQIRRPEQGQSQTQLKASKHTEPDPAEQRKALRVALLPHHTFSQAGKGLHCVSQTVSSSNHLIRGIFAVYCRPLPYSSPS